MQLFNVDDTVFSKIFQFFFDPKNMKKKRPQKLLIYGPQLFFLCTGPAAQTA